MPQINVVAPLRCDRCSGQSYLTAQIPHPSYVYPELQPGLGMLTFHLCPHCDKNDARAHGLLAYFAFHSMIDAESLEDFAALVNEWVQSLSVTRAVDPASFQADVDAYHKGEYD